MMAYVAIAGCLMGYLAAWRDALEPLSLLVLASLFIVIPVHLAIEGNRRDAAEARRNRVSHEE